MKTQAVLAPHQLRLVVQSKQGTAIGDEGDDGSVGQHKGVLNSPVGFKLDFFRRNLPPELDVVCCEVEHINVPAVLFVRIGHHGQNILHKVVHQLVVPVCGYEGLRQRLGLFHGFLEEVREPGKLVNPSIGPSEVKVTFGAVLHRPTEGRKNGQGDYDLRKNQRKTLHNAKMVQARPFVQRQWGWMTNT